MAAYVFAPTIRPVNQEAPIAFEHATTQLVRKPWGSADLRPWSSLDTEGVSIGEFWFQRTDKIAPDPKLLLKLLFTKQPLSIQVHPDDAFAQSIGLANGKTEAWYILSAAPDAEVAIGLKRLLSPTELRVAIEDSSIVGMVKWRSVQQGDVYSVPAEQFTRLARGLFSSKFNSEVMPRFAFSITIVSAICTSRTLWLSPMRVLSKSNLHRSN